MNTSVADKPRKLVSIITASNRPHNMRGFLENLNATVDNYDVIEVLAKIDIGDTAMLALMMEAVEKYPFEIRYIQTPRLNGYYTLHYGYQQLFEMSNPETYFIFPVNEEVRFKTKGWDTILAGYQAFYKDHLFRLKISRLKYRNYYSVYEAGPTPENYPFATRKWMELAGGIGDCWGPDGWHQYIDFHLGQTEGINGLAGIFRSVPILDIEITGEEAGKELTPDQIRVRSHKIYQEWWRMYSVSFQHEFRRIASRMFAYIWAENQKIGRYTIEENLNKKCFLIKNENTQCIEKQVDYHLSTTYINLSNYSFLVRMARRNSIGHLTAFIYPSYGSKQWLVKYTHRLVRYLLTLIAVALSFFTTDHESFPHSIMLRQYYRCRQVVSYIKRKMFKNAETVAKEPESYLDDPFLRALRRVQHLVAKVCRLSFKSIAWLFKALQLNKLIRLTYKCIRFALNCVALKVDSSHLKRGLGLLSDQLKIAFGNLVQLMVRLGRFTVRFCRTMGRFSVAMQAFSVRAFRGIKSRVYYPNPLKRGE